MALLSLLAAAGLATASTATAEAAPGDGLTTIAGVDEGATSPTIYPMQRRLAKTDEGRLLALYVPHQGGPQLTWRDPDGAWQTKTTGENTSGRLLTGTASGVNPASIAVGTDAAGEEHAWVVFGGGSTSSTLPVQLRRLSNLDSLDGPSIGPLVTLASSGSKPDIEFVATPGGASRAVVVWSETLSSTSYKLHAGWLDDLGTDTPALTEQQTLATSAAERLWGTLAVGPLGTTRLIARISGGRIVSFTYQPGTPTGNWTQGADGATATGHGYHSAVTLDSGETLVAIDDVTGTAPEVHQVKVQRFSATGTPAAIAELTTPTPPGYSNPTLSTDGTNAWLVMTRVSDGYVVSRQMSAGGVWSLVDQVEIGAEGGGTAAQPSYPNLLRRTHSRLRLLVGGPQGASASQHSVLYFQRLTGAVADADDDDVPDSTDNCPSIANASQADADADGQGDACDPFPNDPDDDVDSDGVSGDVDNCPNVSNVDQADNDGDGQGDVCDADDDNDGVLDTGDNCQTDANPTQPDIDSDGLGDACDSDDDGDGDLDGDDNCREIVNADQANADGDSEGDACDADDDNDGTPDSADAFPLNADEDTDSDLDGVGDNADNCPATANASQSDTDSDGQGNACDPFPGDPDNDADSDGVGGDTDNCPAVANAGQADTDGDAQGDACDSDDDNDTVVDGSDNCPTDVNADQANNDGDAEGDACDADDDNDTVVDGSDNCPTTANAGQTNSDSDSQGDACDSDDDNDTVADGTDNCPTDVNAGQTDTDSDGQGDACDSDDDNDGTPDTSDAFPTDPDEDTDTDADAVGDDADNCPALANVGQTDSDSDGQGDACDPDNDNDGVLDSDDECPAQPGPASGSGCPSAGGEIRVDVESPQRQTGKKVLVRAAVTCQQACTATGVGTVKISGAGKKTKPIEIGSGSVLLSAGQTTIVTLKPPGPRYMRKIHAAIDKGLTVKAKIRFEIDDGRGDLTVVSHRVELT